MVIILLEAYWNRTGDQGPEKAAGMNLYQKKKVVQVETLDMVEVFMLTTTSEEATR
jgi:hypothetical protein